MTDNTVLTRYLVTQKGQFRPGGSTVIIEHLSNGQLVIRQSDKSAQIKHKIENPQTHLESGEGNKILLTVNDKNKPIIYKFSSELEKLKFLEAIQNNAIPKNAGPMQYPHSTRMFSYFRNEKSRLFIHNVHGMRQGSVVSHCGMLVFTNYRIVFVQYKSKSHIMPSEVILMKYATVTALEIPNLSALSYERCKTNKKTIIISTKDFRTIRFDFSEINDTNSSLFKLTLTTLDQCVFPNKLFDTFAHCICSKTGTKSPADDSHSSRPYPMDNAPDIEDNDIDDEKYEMKIYQNDYTPPKLGGILSFGKNKKKPNTLNKDYMDLSFNLGNECVKSMLHTCKKQTNKLQNELSRICEMGNGRNKLKQKFRISKVNKDLSFCSTYPSLFIVPAVVDDQLLRKSAKFRSKQRLPVIVWSNVDGISISRSAQPLPGVIAKRNKYDEEYLSLLPSTNINPYRRILFIFDMRPKVNAIANRMKGSGYEMQSGYSDSCEIKFMDIDNIHVMRESLNNMISDCILTPKDDEWMIRLTNCEWLNHLSKVLYASIEIVQTIIRDKYNVLIHCSDGWDRTSQCSALAQLILDPYYRTLNGFLLLVQKEFIWFGHKFAHRLGNFGKTPLKKLSAHERSPIFVQFLDTVYQVMLQQPNIFEFSEEFLLTLYDCAVDGMYGDFFCDSNIDRFGNIHSSESTYSIFSNKSPFHTLHEKEHHQSNFMAFTTPSNSPEPPYQNKNKNKNVQRSYKALYINKDYDANNTSNTRLIVKGVQYEVSCLAVWNKCYGRFNKYDVDLRDSTQTALNNTHFSLWEFCNLNCNVHKIKEVIFMYTSINYLLILNAVFCYFYTLFYHYNYYFINQDTNPFISNKHFISLLILCFIISICCSIEWKQLRICQVCKEWNKFNIKWFVGSFLTLLLYSSLFIHYITYDGVEYKLFVPFFKGYKHFYSVMIGVASISIIGLLIHYLMAFLEDDKQKHFKLKQKLNKWSSTSSKSKLLKYNSASVYLKLYPQNVIEQNKSIIICIKMLDIFEIRKSLLYIFSLWITYLLISNIDDNNNTINNNNNNSWYLMIIMSIIYICYSLIAIVIKEKSGIQSKICTEIGIKLGRKLVYIVSCIVISFGLGSYYTLIVLYEQNFIGLLPNKQLHIVISLMILIISIILFCGIIPFVSKWILYCKYVKIIDTDDQTKHDTESQTIKDILANELRPFFVKQ